MESLLNCDDLRHLVLGRPGFGKTALIKRLVTSGERVIEISPENLALSYISNSTILRYVTEELNVTLGPFFRVLWQHILTVELLRQQFAITDANAQSSFFAQMRSHFKSREEVEALEYMEGSGKSFWNDVEQRVKEETTTLEKKLKATLDAKAPKFFSGNAEASGSITAQEKQEFIYHASQVINDVHIKKLPQVTDYALKKLQDKQKRYYIVIDRLDEDWVDDRYRYQLIRSLIEASRSFNGRNKSHVKVIIALRRDLIERVFVATKDPGFQAEKYQSLYINIQWSKSKLEELLDTRINHLVRGRHPAQRVSYRDILPRTINKQPAIDYLLSRTLMRPRDVIDFFNRCIELAEGSPRLTESMVKDAEYGYSQSRVQALMDEWRADYPSLRSFLELLKKRPPTFSVSDISLKECEELCLQFAVQSPEGQDILTASAVKVANGEVEAEWFRRLLVSILYKVSLIGLNLETYETVSWSTKDNYMIEQDALSLRTHIHIHPCAWRVLGITSKRYDATFERT